jgi:hypothetical protein
MFFEPNQKIISVTLVNGKLEVIRKIPSNLMYGNGLSTPDSVFKDIYGVKGDEIVLEQTIQGKHTPPQNIPEKIEFDEEEVPPYITDPNIPPMPSPVAP